MFLPGMLAKILDPDQEDLLEREREALRSAQVLLASCGASEEDLAALERSVRQLDRLFLLVVVGEFNAGKSTFINALLGRSLLDEGVTPTTRRLLRVIHGDSVETGVDEQGIDVLEAPVELLERLEIVDTPGTNALDRDHEAITHEFVPRSDLVLFVTSADRPFSESERAFLESIRRWGKKVVVVVNKVDFLGSEKDRAEIESFIRERAVRLLDFNPDVFLVSAQQALQSKLEGDRVDLAAKSRFFPLERYLHGVLDDIERIRLKLGNPLGVAIRLITLYSTAVRERTRVLHEDFAALEEIDLSLGLYQEDMRRQFRFRLSDVERDLDGLAARGDRFFDEIFRLARAVDLMNRERVRAEFSRQVVADVPRDVEQKVDQIIDWMIQGELQQWQGVKERLERRLERHSDRLVGTVGTFDYDREQLLATVGRAAGAAIDGFDPDRQAERLADTVRSAIAGTALMEVGALGLGAVIGALATTQLVDVTGLLAAGTLAVLGFFVLPARKRRARAELATKIADLRHHLLTTLEAEFEREIARSVERVQESVAPYTGFVRAERQRLHDHAELLAKSDATLERLRREIQAL